MTVIASVAQQEISKGGNNWPTLLQFIAAAVQDASPDARELGFFLLFEMTETIGENLTDQFGPLSQLYGKGLTDENQKVQVSALKSLGNLMAYLADEDESVAVFAGLVPTFLQAASSCQSRNDEDAIQTVNDVMYDLSHSSCKEIAAHIPSFIGYALQVLGDKNLELTTRDSAALVISTLIEFKPKLVAKKANVDLLIETFMNLIEDAKESAAGAFFDNNPAWKEDAANEDDSDDEDYDGPTQCGMAQGCLDMLACNLPQKYIFQPIITKCIARMTNAANPAARKAGIASLGVAAEGCGEKLTDHLVEVMPYVLQCANDGDPQVRECTCFYLGQLAEHCQPEILEYSTVIIPAVLKLLEDTSVSIQTTSCYVLEMFCEHLQPESVKPFLDVLMRKLVSMLEVATRRCVQEMTVAAIAATAVAAETLFIPYLPGSAGLMQRMMSMTDEKQFSLKGRAMECMGHMAIAVEKDAFRPYFTETMRCTCEALTFESIELHEYAYAVFANLSKVMGREFSPVLPELVPHLCSVIGAGDGQEEQAHSEAAENADLQSLAMNPAAAFKGLDDSDDEDEQEGYNYAQNGGMVVRTAMLETKKAAISALGEMAKNCAQDFIPYMQQSVEVMGVAGDYWHPTIKAEVIIALPGFIVASVAANHADGKVPWEKGNVSPAAVGMTPATQALANALIGKLVEYLADTEKEVVSAACESLQGIVELCGPHALLPQSAQILEAVLKLMNSKAPCQEETEDDEEDEEEDGEHDSYMTSTFDLLGGISRVMGAQFAPFLPQFITPIVDFAKTSRPVSDRSMALGCLGELAEGLGTAISPHWNTVWLPIMMGGLADEEPTIRRNAAYTCGICCEALGDSIAAQYPQLLQALFPLFQIDASASDNNAAVVDNAAAAVARMITAAPQSVPYDAVLPIFLKVLPLKSDHTENGTVLDCIMALTAMQQPNICGELRPEVMRVVGEAMNQPKVEDETKAKLRVCFGICSGEE